MTAEEKEDIPTLMNELGKNARAAARQLAKISGSDKNRALMECASEIADSRRDILAANAKDMQAAEEKGVTTAMLDRLRLSNARIDNMVSSIETIVGLKDPVGKIMAEWSRPNGLRFQQVSVPLGVIGIIYESRPNVTVDAAVLCLKAANAVILRGGSLSYHSNRALHQCMANALRNTNLPFAAVQMVPTSNRDAVGFLLSEMAEFVDVIIPRGGKNLIARVQSDARVPVIGHLQGICHVYVHQSADPAMAVDIVLNAKMRRTGICGAAETLLIDKNCISSHLPLISNALIAANCELRGDETARTADPRIKEAAEDDWSSEYLDAILSIKSVDGIDDAIAHIAHYGTAHTESIVAEDADAARQFQAEVDSAIVLHNASTQFADGGEFGMGAEIGIATGKIHARGPVGVEQLTSYKYLVHGTGHVRA